MRWIIFFLIFLVLFDIVNAQELNDYQDLKLDVKVQGNVDVIKQPGSYQFEYFSSELSFFTRNDRFQTVTSDELLSSPSAEISRGDNLIYRWEEYSPEMSFGVDSKIDVSTNFYKINKKIKFPIQENMVEFQDYLQPSDLVNSDNQKIITQAEKLADGEDDLYVVTYKIGKWTKENINYSLDSLTAQASQNSVWVYENREGVCDELTTLFISMLRSLGVPARFALGSSYTNAIGGFGNHAWAEVYFPEVGWVAFDPTYGQFGYVDSTHVKMKEGNDPRDPSINYMWRSRNVDIKPKEVDIEVGVISKGDILKYNVDMDLNLLRNNVGEGSYVPLKIALKNNENYYLPVTLYLTRGPTVIEDNSIDILLKPNENTIAFFHIYVPEELEKNLVYESELEVEGPGGIKRSVNLNYGESYNIYTKEEAQARIEQIQKEEEGNIKIEMSCSPEKEVYYTYEDKGVVVCSLINKEDMDFKGIKLCFEDDCKDIDLLNSEEKIVKFDFNLEQKDRESFVRLEDHNLSRSSYFNFNVLTDADVRVVDLEYPKTLDYRSNGEVKFSLDPNSKVNSVEVKVGGKKVFMKEELAFRNDFLVPFDGDFFYFKNPYIEITYNDINGKEHIVREVINIEITSIPWYAKVMKIFNF